MHGSVIGSRFIGFVCQSNQRTDFPIGFFDAHALWRGKQLHREREGLTVFVDITFEHLVRQTQDIGRFAAVELVGLGQDAVDRLAGRRKKPILIWVADKRAAPA